MVCSWSTGLLKLKTPDDDATDHCLRKICRLFSGRKEGRKKVRQTRLELELEP
jgi:hypothetical protein